MANKAQANLHGMTMKIQEDAILLEQSARQAQTTYVAGLLNKLQAELVMAADYLRQVNADAYLPMSPELKLPEYRSARSEGDLEKVDQTKLEPATAK
jgi:hypothetical protein